MEKNNATFFDHNLIELTLLRCPKTDVDVRNTWNKGALDYARERQNEEIVEAIESRDELVKSSGQTCWRE